MQCFNNDFCSLKEKQKTNRDYLASQVKHILTSFQVDRHFENNDNVSQIYKLSIVIEYLTIIIHLIK